MLEFCFSDSKIEILDVVCDFNGTLALDGSLLPCVRTLLPQIADLARVHVITADTYGTARREIEALRNDGGEPFVFIHAIGARNGVTETEQKAAIVEKLGTKTTLAIGNGRNDQKMIKEAAIGIAVCQREGAFGGTVANADLVVFDIAHALELILNPKRMVAGLRE